MKSVVVMLALSVGAVAAFVIACGGSKPPMMPDAVETPVEPTEAGAPSPSATPTSAPSPAK